MTSPKDEKTLEIARRTRKNLEFIYSANQQGKDVEEFTQLLNSMLGMMISLREDYFRGSDIAWQRVQDMGLKNYKKDMEIKGNTPTSESPNLDQINSFSQLITRLRNAFAHNCFDLVIDENTDQIIGVRVWNVPTGKPNNKGHRVWEAEIMEVDLKRLAYLFVEYLEKELGI
jgi:hypothetical protein